MIYFAHYCTHYKYNTYILAYEHISLASEKAGKLERFSPKRYCKLGLYAERHKRDGYL